MGEAQESRSLPIQPVPPFCSQIRASGLAEIWTHSQDDDKFQQFGWRCTNKENSYSNDTLVGNWNEHRFDISKQKCSKPLPSPYDHYFDTTYDTSYNTQQHTVPETLKNLKGRHSHAHPGHQPEFDHPSLRAIYNSFETTSRAAYVEPKTRLAPITPPQY